MKQMNRISGNRVALVFSAMLLSIVFSVFMVQAAGTALVRVSPAITNAGLGQTFSVDINISTAEKVYGWQFDLRYNSSVLRIISVSEGNFLKQDGANTSFSGGVINNTLGTLKSVYCSRMVTPNGINGTGALATVTFNATGIGTSRIDLAKVGQGLKIVDELINPVTAIETNGTAVIVNANRPPLITWYSPVNTTPSVMVGYPIIQFNHTSSDPDGDALNYSWKINGLLQATTQSWLFNYSSCGKHNVSLAVTDTHSAFAGMSWVVNVYLAGDTNNDSVVDVYDLSVVCMSFGKSSTDQGWDPRADINSDGVVNAIDLYYAVVNFNKSCA